MLFIDTNFIAVAQIIVTSFIGMFMLAIGLEGFLLVGVPWPIRIVSIIGGLCLIDPALLTDVIGIAVLVFVILTQVTAKRKLGFKTT